MKNTLDKVAAWQTILILVVSKPPSEKVVLKYLPKLTIKWGDTLVCEDGKEFGAHKVKFAQQKPFSMLPQQ